MVKLKDQIFIPRFVILGDIKFLRKLPITESYMLKKKTSRILIPF